MPRGIKYKPRMMTLATTHRLRRLHQTQNRRADVGCLCSPPTQRVFWREPFLQWPPALSVSRSFTTLLGRRRSARLRPWQASANVHQRITRALVSE